MTPGPLLHTTSWKNYTHTISSSYKAGVNPPTLNRYNKQLPAPPAPEGRSTAIRKAAHPTQVHKWGKQLDRSVSQVVIRLLRKKSIVGCEALRQWRLKPPPAALSVLRARRRALHVIQQASRLLSAVAVAVAAAPAPVRAAGRAAATGAAAGGAAAGRRRRREPERTHAILHPRLAAAVARVHQLLSSVWWCGCEANMC